MLLTKWVPTTDPMMLRRMGKLGEELGELLAVTNRCIIQGINEVDPGTGRSNRDRLIDELADVKAQITCTENFLQLVGDAYMHNRVRQKIALMEEWERLSQEL